MVWITLTILLAIAAVVLVLARRRIDQGKHGRLALGLVGIAVVWLITTIAMSVSAIASGEVGVVRNFGKIVGQRSEGIAFRLPWQTIDVVSVRTQHVTFDKITAASSETQDVYMTETLNYAVTEQAVQSLLRNVGANWFEVLVPSRILNFTKEETARFSTTSIIPAREEIRQAVKARLAKDLEPYSISVVDLLIDNITFNQEFLSAIEQKQIATQRAQEEAAKVASEKAKADQLRASAQGQADANVIRAKADADAAVIRAKADAEANKLLSASLTPQIVQWQAINKLGPNVNIALIPSGNGLIIDPATILGGGLPPPSTTLPK